MSAKRMSVSLVLPAVVAGLLLSAAPAAQATSAPANDNFAQAVRRYVERRFVPTSNEGATAQPGEPTILGLPRPRPSGSPSPRTRRAAWSSVRGPRVRHRARRLHRLGDQRAGSRCSERRHDFGGIITPQSRIELQRRGRHRVPSRSAATTAATSGPSSPLVDGQRHFAAALPRPPVTTRGQACGLSADNDGATLEPNEPVIGDAPGTASEWFTYQPVFTGFSTFATQSSTFAPLIGVYTGATLQTLKQVQVGGGSVSFAAAAGQTYRIAVEGALGGALPQTGYFGLQYTQSQAAVSIANATTVEGNSGTHSMPFTVKLSAPSAAPVSVTYTTAASRPRPAATTWPTSAP